MTDAPERIWATGNGETGSWNAIEGRMKSYMPDGWQTEYVRADLEATALPSTATSPDDPRVLALETIEKVAQWLDDGGDWSLASDLRNDAEMLADPNNPVWQENDEARAALAISMDDPHVLAPVGAANNKASIERQDGHHKEVTGRGIVLRIRRAALEAIASQYVSALEENK